MLRAIREISPSWIVGENVRGLTNWNGGLVFDEVQADLEAIGYEILPFLLPACAVNAPHRRDRIWFIAYSDKHTTGPSGKSTDIKRNESDNNIQQSEWRGKTKLNSRLSSISRNATDSESKRSWEQSQEDTRWENRRFDNNGEISDATNTNSERIEKCNISTDSNRTNKSDWSHYENRGNWQNFPTVSPVCNGDDGLSDRLDLITFPKWRNESIKAGGNAVVPQVVYQIFKAIELF